MRNLFLLTACVLALGGCYSRRSASVSDTQAKDILSRDGFPAHKDASGVDSGWAWQRPNNPPSALCFGLIFTRHRVEKGEVISETYGWSLLPGLFGILPGLIVNIPIPLEDETQIALTRGKN